MNNQSTKHSTPRPLGRGKGVWLLLLLLCCMTATKVSAVDVATADELKNAIVADNGADIKLTTNINVSGLGKLCETFTGTIDGTINFGRGWALIGATEPFFDQLKGATLKNIVIQDFNINSPEASQHAIKYQDLAPCYGMLACVATDGCKFENVLVENCDLVCDCSLVGAFVGWSDGSTFEDCSVDNHCALYSKVSVHNLSYNGAFVGQSDSDTFKNCVNGALVAVDNALALHLGGMAGLARGTRMEACVNCGITVPVEDENYTAIYEAYKSSYLPGTSMYHRDKGYFVQSLSDELCDKLYYALYIGGLVGLSANCDFVDCANLAPCYYGWNEGGIAGTCLESNFDLCINYGTVYGRIMGDRNPNRGGISGSMRGPNINNCMNLGTFPGLEGCCGSIAQIIHDEGSTIRNCFSAVAGVPVYDSASDLTAESGNNYALGTSRRDVKSWMYVTQKMLSSGIVTYWLNKGTGNHDREVKPWRQNIGQEDYPVLDPSHDVVEYEDLAITMTPISTRKQLEDFALRVNHYEGAYENAILTADIDMSGRGVVIGTVDNPYRGIFDGAGHSIDNQELSGGFGGTGLFGTVGTHAEIRNLTIGSDSQIKGGSTGTGGIVGGVLTSAKWGFVTIENCGNKGFVQADAYAGGILGKVDCADNIKVYVNNCYSVGDVRVNVGNSALLCGYMKNSGVVTNSWAYARLSAYGAIPFGINATNDQQNHFVGYYKTLDISKCYTFDSAIKVDTWQPSKRQDGVFDYPSQMLNNGTFVYLINGKTNDQTVGLTWQQNLGSYPEPGSKGLYHTREVASEYGTICLPYVLKSNDDIQYYALSSVEDNEDAVNLHFEAINEVAAGMPALFRVKAAGTYSFSDAGDDYVFILYDTGEEAQWRMLGTYDQKVFEDDKAKEIYYLSDDEIKNTPTTTIDPYQAYIQGPDNDTLSGKTVKIVIDGEITALEFIGDDLAPVQHNGKTYSLMGTEVGNGYRGIVIKNGRKYIRK